MGVTYLNVMSGNDAYLQTGVPSPEMKKLEMASEDWETTEIS